MKNIYAKYIRTGEIIFKYAKGMRDIIGKEMHTYHEIFFFIGGDAEFICELGKEKLLPGTTVIIPKETFHQFVVFGPECDYHRCVFNFENVSELNSLIDQRLAKIMLIQNDEISAIFQKLRNLIDSPMEQPETNILTKALFAQLLVQIKEMPRHEPEHSPIDVITQNALSCINASSDYSFTVSELANVLHISSSHLSHIFKKDLHISVYKYILEKRLILANRRIREGIPPTQAASECGFSDYAGFYRQYKKMFGQAPSEAKVRK